MHTYSDGTAIHVGDIVRRGKGKTTWRVIELTEQNRTPVVALKSTADDFTSASAFGEAIAALTPLTRTSTEKAPMTITAARIALSEAVTRAVHALPARPQAPSETTITIAPEAGQLLRVIGSSYDTHIETVLPAQFADGTPPIVAPARLVAEWLKVDKGVMITLTVEERELVLTGARTLRATLPLSDPAQPFADPGEGQAFVTIDRDVLIDALKRTAGSAGKDPLNPVFTGVKLEAGAGVLTVTATDRYKIAHVEVPCTGDGHLAVLPPHRTLATLLPQMGASVTLATSGGVLWLLDEVGTRARTALLDDTFPKLQHLVETKHPLVTALDAAALRAELSAASRLIGLSTSSRDSGVTLVTDGDHVSVLTSTGDHSMSGTGSPVAASGDPLEVYLNPAYLLQALDAVGPAERIRLSHYGPGLNKPIRLDAEDSNGVAVLMPMRRVAS